MRPATYRPGDIVMLRSGVSKQEASGRHNYRWARVESSCDDGSVKVEQDLHCQRHWHASDLRKIKLSDAQKVVLEEVEIRFPNKEQFSAYDAGCAIRTLDSLADKGLLERDNSKLGHIAYPRVCILFRVNR